MINFIKYIKKDLTFPLKYVILYLVGMWYKFGGVYNEIY